MTVSKQPGHRGARRKPLKPLRAGMPGDSGVLVVTRVRSTTTSAHEAAGAKGIRRSPRPLRGGRFINGSGAWRGEVVNACLDWKRMSGLERRHCEERSDEAIHSFFARHDGLLRFARNDVIARLSRHTLSRHRPRMRATQYSEASMMESRCRHSSCPGLTRASIHLRKTIFEEDGLPGRARQ